MPEMRAACPIVSGRWRASVWRVSIDKAAHIGVIQIAPAARSTLALRAARPRPAGARCSPRTWPGSRLARYRSSSTPYQSVFRESER
jgi:hypothetical protein